MKVDIKEILRYLGYGRNKPDGETLALIDECISDLQKICEPKHVYRRFALKMPGHGRVKAGILEMVSCSLEGNLKDCEEMILFAATLGSGSDMLMNRYLHIAISKAAVFQAVAASAIEQYCNECQSIIANQVKKEKLYLRPRFSPGYGDLSLAVQKDLLNALDAQKIAGIFLSDSGMMMPEKSVTALIGLSRSNNRCQMNGCEVCGKKDCAYRR